MVLPVGGFFPIPLAMMIPFMATQSLVMGEAFGKAFQFGKRKISAMSNDEFNELKIEKVASEMFQSYKNILPELKQSIADSSDFQNHIFAQLILLGPNLIKALGGAVLTDIAEKVVPTSDITSEGVRVRQPGITDIPVPVDTTQDFLPPKKPSKIHFAGKPQLKTMTRDEKILDALKHQQNLLIAQRMRLGAGGAGVAPSGPQRVILMKKAQRINLQLKIIAQKIHRQIISMNTKRRR